MGILEEKKNWLDSLDQHENTGRIKKTRRSKKYHHVVVFHPWVVTSIRNKNNGYTFGALGGKIISNSDENIKTTVKQGKNYRWKKEKPRLSFELDRFTSEEA